MICSYCQTEDDRCLMDGEDWVCPHCQPLVYLGEEFHENCERCRGIRADQEKPQRKAQEKPQPYCPPQVEESSSSPDLPGSSGSKWKSCEISDWERDGLHARWHATLIGTRPDGRVYRVRIHVTDPQDQFQVDAELSRGKALLDAFLTCSCEPGRACGVHQLEVDYGHIRGAYAQ